MKCLQRKESSLVLAISSLDYQNLLAFIKHFLSLYCVRLIKSANYIFYRTCDRVTFVLFEFVCTRDRSFTTESSKTHSALQNQQSITLFKGAFLLRMNEAPSHLHLSHHQFISPSNERYGMSCRQNHFHCRSLVQSALQLTACTVFTDNFTAITKR